MSDGDLASWAGPWVLGVTIAFVFPAAAGVPMDTPGLQLTLLENAICIGALLAACPFFLMAGGSGCRDTGGEDGGA